MYSNYIVPIIHPTTQEPVDARVSFYYTPSSPEREDEPFTSHSVEIITVKVGGIDVYELLTSYEIRNIEGLLEETVYCDEY